MNENLIRRVLSLYNLEVIKVYTPAKGYRNSSYPVLTDKGKINLILYKNEEEILDRIKRANLVSNYLSDKGFPTRKVMESNNNEVILIKDKDTGFKRYLCLYNYLNGNTIPWEAYSMEHIKLLGKALSDIHYELNKSDLVSKMRFPKVIDELLEINERMKRYFNRRDVVDAVSSKLSLNIDGNWFERFTVLLNELKKLDNQILHMDFVRSNLLFSNSDSSKGNELIITGILDFEKTSVGPRIVDIARTLAFLIVDCKYKEEVKVRKYLLHSGYSKRGKFELPDLEYLNSLLEFFWFYDFYKFLKYNPYEYLKQNEHYIRTMRKLICCSMSRYTDWIIVKNTLLDKKT